jgi:hypothetical protein
MNLQYDKIRQDGGTQPRGEILIAIIDDYAEQMLAGAEFPPVVVFFDGRDYWLADGFHRARAWHKAFPTKPLVCDVHQGTQAEAKWYSYGANQTHGLRRTNEDKQRAVKAALQHPQGASKSDRQIAEHVGVHHDTVGRHRKELQASTVGIRQSPKRQGKDGRTINTAKIGNGKKKVGKPRSSVKPLAPIYDSSELPKSAHVTLPHDPAAAARTLVVTFDSWFLRRLIAELQSIIPSEESAA